MTSEFLQSAPWRRRNRSRSRNSDGRAPGHRPAHHASPAPWYHNPTHPLAQAHRNLPQPSAALTERVQNDMQTLRQEVEWGDKMRPSDPDWVADAHDRCVQINKDLFEQPPPKLLTNMPRNPSTMRYE